MEQDWDNLFVLDGCRYDLFESVIDTEQFDTFRRMISLGGATPEWTEQNFAEKSFGDTVYIASNPFVSKIAPNSFHKIIEVWRESFDESAGTVRSNPVLDAARNALETYPNKRVIVHLMQPHHPFIGSERFKNRSWSVEDVGQSQNSDMKTPWEALQKGELERDNVWSAYRENLESVIDDAIEAAVSFDGRSVVTSDHGNLLGTRSYPIPMREFGHFNGLRHKDLVHVPWAVISGERRSIQDHGIAQVEQSKDVVNDRLRQLGYRQ
ncbi:hypothetical protein [Haloparvum sp. PAK95]|uniref:hypothetical protein n=1 Tax=Haloparvum sp. PAK95 TaxID=3418962 RepID=UPI003D2EAC62